MQADPTSTTRHHRVLRATPERIYRAFLDADAMAKWLPPNGFTGRVHEMDAKVGGGYKMSFPNFGTGSRHSFGSTYLELKPHERIRYSSRFDNPGLPGEMQTTITLKQVFCGTDLSIIQEGNSRGYPSGSLLPGLAGIADIAGEIGGAGNSGPAVRLEAEACIRTTIAAFPAI